MRGKWVERRKRGKGRDRGGRREEIKRENRRRKEMWASGLATHDKEENQKTHTISMLRHWTSA